MKLGVIGGGRAAWAFGRAWSAAGLPVCGVALRAGSSSPVSERLGVPRLPPEKLAAEADLLLFAVPDDAIPRISADLLPHLRAGAFRFHASGSLTSAALGDGEHAFSLHPLAALPPAGSVQANPRMVLVFEGPDATIEPASRVAATFASPLLRIDPELKPLYHAGAVFGANHLAALLEISAGILTRVGLPEREARGSIAALARSAVENWESAPPGERFTGPVSRGDAATVAGHLESLGGDPTLLELYRRLSLELAKAVAKERTHSPEIAEIIDLLRNWRVS